MRKLSVGVAVLAMAAGLSGCQTDNTPRVKLTKAEVVNLISDTNWSNSGGNNGSTFADGRISASNVNSSSDGTWTVTDDGDVCVSWNNARWTGGCAPIYRVGTTDKYERTLPTTGPTQSTYTKKK